MGCVLLIPSSLERALLLRSSLFNRDAPALLVSPMPEAPIVVLAPGSFSFLLLILPYCMHLSRYIAFWELEIVV
jgi:hypothetical protein